jgi:hypothetical protein
MLNHDDRLFAINGASLRDGGEYSAQSKEQ